MKTWVIIGFLLIILIVLGVYAYISCDTDFLDDTFTKIKNSTSTVGYKIKAKFE